MRRIQSERPWTVLAILALCGGILGSGSVVAAPDAAHEIVKRHLGKGLSKPRAADAKVDTVILHFSSAVIKTPDKACDPEAVIAMFEACKVSAHYLIARDGTVYELVDESRRAFHAGEGKRPVKPVYENELNMHSIGIELIAVGDEADMKTYLTPKQYGAFKQKHPEAIGYTDAQYAALDRLLGDIAKRHDGIKRDRSHVFGHSECASGRKSDPGGLFDWSRIGLPVSAWLDGRVRSDVQDEALYVVAFALPDDPPGAVVVTWGTEQPATQQSVEAAVGLYAPAGKPGDMQAAQAALERAQGKCMIYCAVGANTYAESLRAAAVVPTVLTFVPLSLAGVRGVLDIVLPAGSGCRDNPVVLKLYERLAAKGAGTPPAAKVQPSPGKNAKREARPYHLVYEISMGAGAGNLRLDIFQYSSWHDNMDKAQAGAEAAARLVYCRARPPALCSVKMKLLYSR